MPSRTADVAIVGGGVIGLSIAYELARRTNLRIAVLERDLPGSGASNAAAGVLAVASGNANPGFLLELRRRSLALYPDLVDSLQADSSIDVQFRRCGVLSIALDESESDALCALSRRRQAQGMATDILSASEARILEPRLSAGLSIAALFQDDAVINNIRLCQALAEAVRRRGVELLCGTEVRRIAVGRESTRLHCDDCDIDSATIVVASGVWSVALMATAGIRVPQRPVRGEMIAVEPAAGELRHVISHNLTYLVPRGAEVLVGSTTVVADFENTVRVSGVRTLIREATRLMPELANATLCRWWAGLRPCPTIRHPIVAPLEVGGGKVILATGHHRNGILLAPITARLVTEMILGLPATVSLRPLAYHRR